MKTYDIVIIGAGSIGLPLSYELSRRGLKVAVLDREASPGRGQNRAAIGGIRATHSDPAKITICRRSIEEVKKLELEHGMQVDWIEGGYLFPVYDEQREKSLKNLLTIQKKFNLNIDWVSPKKVEELVPGISTNELRGGTFSPQDGSASPLKVALAYYGLARSAGADFYFNENVSSFKLENKKILQVNSDKNSFASEMVVDASGADARLIGQLVGIDIPVFPDSHEGGITEPVNRFFEPMVVDIRPEKGSANYYFYQNKEGQVVFCITPNSKIEGKDCDCTSSFLPMVVRRMVSLYPRLRNLRVRRTWRGLYPMTPDGFPIVGCSNDVENLMLAVGMCGQGFMLGPGLGIILSDILVDKSTEHQAILDQLSLYRDFTGQEVLK